MSNTSLFCLVFFIPLCISKNLSTKFIVWNVGQGSFSTLVTPSHCLHIDMGGEFYPRDVSKLCRGHKNYLLLTHFDTDHINMVDKFLRHEHLCTITPIPKKIKTKFHLKTIKLCPKHNLTDFKLLHKPTFRINNDSYIYIIANFILITGDAPKKIEQKLKLTDLTDIKIMLAGHHGSNTSSSENLLLKLKAAYQVVVSARKQRYGHPHPLVIKKCREHYLSMLATESFGNIIFEL